MSDDRFVLTWDGENIPVSEVKSWRWLDSEHTKLAVRTKDGEFHKAFEVSAAALLEPSQGPVVAATPDYFTVSLTPSNEDDDLSDFTTTPDLIPVVAWQTHGYRGNVWVEPISCYDGERDLAVLAPNGVVYSPADGLYRSLAEYIKQRNFEQREARKRRRAKLFAEFG